MTALPEGIYQIPLPTPLPVGQVNAYLLTGDVPTLVDPGPSTPEGLTALRAGLQQLGFRLQDIWQVLITHPHVDHFGLAGAVAAESGARILAHREAVGVLADPVGSIRHTVRFLRTWGQQQGIPADVLGYIAWGQMKWAAGLGESVAVHEPVEDGETVMAGRDFWRVLYTPGHSSGHICLLRETDGTLIAGDHLLPGAVSSPVLEASGDLRRIRSGTEYLSSLTRLALIDIGTVLPGHGACFTDVSRPFILDRVESIRAKAEAAYDQLSDGPRTLWELCQLLYPRVVPDKLIFALSNVAGYLDLLAVNGRIAPMTDRHGLLRAVALEPLAMAGV